ncbi:hypothetical protein COV93_00560 [Candidatus Woesearchaeota archaeon CG11_big_fil_rev_8_21_14_0_20_43_8]|nr:MAG: hypothetical protein COV93_00560 [Candidatus Woesearchaeota archaeon CG11_big_fil_rev_8_21_14_0_20_43_8]
MVLESLLNPIKAEKKPSLMILFGFLAVSVSILLGLWIFRDHVSLVMVFLTVIACVPIMYSTLRYEEIKDTEMNIKESTLLTEHSKALVAFMFLFLGFVLAFVAFYVFLPNNLVTEVFSIQTNTISNINGNMIASSTGHVSSHVTIFTRIFFNNLKVLMFCLLFSFFYGAGAIFILTWNASVIGAYIGSFIRANIAKYASSVGLFKVGAYFKVIFIGFTKLSFHGIPEIMAYFIGGLAGGIISVAVIRHDFSTKKFEKIILDSADLILISIAILFIAAIIEVFVTPAIF